MIESANSLADGTRLEADVCIVGAGAAGISLALRLLPAGTDILLLEAGGETETEEAKDFYKGHLADPELHSPLHEYRHRVFGGSTATWGGRCTPFDPIDFEARDWIAHSGWPIPYGEVARYYDDAMVVVEAGEATFAASEAIAGGMQKTVAGFAPEHFTEEGIERFSCPTRFGGRYKRRLAEAANVRVLLDANCTEIATGSNGAAVDHLKVRATGGKSLTVRAKRFVLAAGGIEVVRLLLASRAKTPNGLGNEHDLVGRNYMCHVAGTTGAVQFSCSEGDVFHGYERAWDGIYCRRRYQLRPEVQRDLRVGNVILRLHHPRLADPAHGRGILSALYLARPFISYEYAKRLHGSVPPTAREIAHHILNVAREPFGTISFLAGFARARALAARKFPSLIVKPRNNVYSLDVHAEQAPNAQSRITLAGDCDRFGVPRVKVDWRYLPIDLETPVRAVAAFAVDLAAAGKGRVAYDPETVAHDMLRDGAYGGHHLGTARMAARAAEGVVDADCRVFGTENLYLASAAVFPTSSQANPTLTIVALALRLADHLAGRAGPSLRKTAPEKMGTAR